MKKFAQIKDNKVINIFDWKEEKEPRIKEFQHIDITNHKDKDSIKVGWNFENEEFKEPEMPGVDIEKEKDRKIEALRKQAKEEILDRFLSEEKSLLEIAEEVKANMKNKEVELYGVK
ncbi:MAG TPA: hypothetical protein PK333_04665 [Candidatus Moranbacteria bacterium]|nr:hypothetical protein [Candidatus Moranbacteria bacterium]